MGRPRKTRRNGATFMWVDGKLVDALQVAQREIEESIGKKPFLIDASAFVGKTFLDIHEIKKKRKRGINFERF